MPSPHRSITLSAGNAVMRPFKNLSWPNTPADNVSCVSQPVQAEILPLKKLKLPIIEKVKLDPLRICEPYKKNLSSPTAQRVIAILEELRFKCEIVVLLPQVLKDLKSYAPIIGHDLHDLLIRHKSLVDQYNRLERRWADANAGENEQKRSLPTRKTALYRLREGRNHRIASEMSFIIRSKDALTQHAGTEYGRFTKRSDVSTNSISSKTDNNLEDLSTKLQTERMQIESSLKDILRYLRNNSQILEAVVQKAGSCRSKEGNIFIQSLRDLKTIILEKLLVTPNELIEKFRAIKQIKTRHMDNQVTIERLEGDLARAIAEIDEEIKSKNDMIKNLQHTLCNLETATEDDIRRAKTESDKQSQAEQRGSRGRQHKLEAELKEVKSILRMSMSRNRDEEQELRKKKWKFETKVESLVQRYDSEMKEKLDEYEEIDILYQKEKNELAELEERFVLLDKDYKAIIAAREAKRYEEEAGVRLRNIQIQAAATIQALWRSYKVKKTLRFKARSGKRRSGPKKK